MFNLHIKTTFLSFRFYSFSYMSVSLGFKEKNEKLLNEPKEIVC